MTRVGILTDASAGIPHYLVNDLHIEIAASATNLEDYVHGLRTLAERTREIVALTPTAQAAKAYHVCCTAADTVRAEMPDLQIQVVDTQQVAMAHGWAAIEAARVASKGATFAQTVQRAKEVADRSFLVLSVETLPGAQVLVGVVNGEIAVLGKALSRLQAYAHMVELVRERTRGARRVHLAFTHRGAEEETQILRDLYFREMDCIEEMTTPVLPTLAVHPGTGAVGVCLYAE